MSKDNVGEWLERLEKVIQLIKPRFHNAITKTVVIFGLGLSVESQINIFEAMAVAVFESFFGKSEFLRELFATSTSVWIGVTFVIFGLIYNAVVTVGLELVEKYKATIPKKPELKISLVNADGVALEDSYRMRGAICFHEITNIPDFTKNSEKLKDELGITGIGQGLFMSSTNSFLSRVNKDFYRERERFLKVWGGAEIIYLKIFNAGSVVARNVRVEVAIPKLEGLSASNENNLTPHMPSREYDSSFDLAPNFGSKKLSYDIKHSNTSDDYIFEWSAGDVQAQETKSSMTDIFLRTENDCKISVKIYCDEISRPIETAYTIYASRERYEITLPMLKSNCKDFMGVVDRLIMDGYITRHQDKLLRELESMEETLVP